MSTANAMIYPLFELNRFALQPFRLMAETSLAFWGHAANPLRESAFAKQTTAALTMFERATRQFQKPEFGITEVSVNGKTVAVREQVIWQTPFCKVLHFVKSNFAEAQPKLLMVAPMSGHYATLLRDTVQTMLPDFDCYVTDWQDARDIPLSSGSFDLDDYTDTVIAILHKLGERAHVMAVCQPSVPVLAAISMMSESKDKLVPLSMVLMGGPIDTSKSPTAVNQMADSKDLNWFRNNVVMTVPPGFAGAGRSVYPGFMQLSGFLSMNMDRHMKAHRELYRSLVSGDEADARRHEAFYDEYMAVMDLTAEFYLQSVDRVFIRQDFPHGTYQHRGRKVDPSLITDTALLTIEGERDDISGLGQTEAAHQLCSGIVAAKKKHHLQMGAGHYGVFSGSKFRAEIAPIIARFLSSQKA